MSHSKQSDFPIDLPLVPAEKPLGVLDVDVSDEALALIEKLRAEIAVLKAKAGKYEALVYELFRGRSFDWAKRAQEFIDGK